MACCYTRQVIFTLGITILVASKIEVLALGSSDEDDVNTAIIAGMWCSNDNNCDVRKSALEEMKNNPDKFYWINMLVKDETGVSSHRRNVPVKLSTRIVIRK